MCFRCLEQGHLLSECESKQNCAANGCVNKRHHTLLHRHVANSTNGASSSSPSEPQKAFCATATENKVNDRRPYFMTVPVRIHYGENLTSTYALLDTGSQKTFCDRHLANRLEATGPKASLPIKTLYSGADTRMMNGSLISLSVQSMDGDGELNLKEVFTVDKTLMYATPLPSCSQLSSMTHLQGIQFPELNNKFVGLLIGLDVPGVFRPLESRYGQEGEPDAIRTLLGWTLFCFAEMNTNQNSVNCFDIMVPQREDLDFPPHEFSQTCGLNEDNSREDKISFQIMKNSIQQIDGHFQLSLLWRSKSPMLPNNTSMAKKRLESLKRRLKNRALHEKYTSVMQFYIDQGYAELAENKEPALLEPEGLNWFLPHHPVVNPRKPDKLRIVYDCAATFMGTSLNGALMQGPYLNNSLVGVLTRFRLERIAVASNVEAMFHQVKVDPKDRNVLKFLWWPGGNLKRHPVTYRMTVHLFEATSSPSCAVFALQKAANRFGKKGLITATNVIKHNFYVDDCLFSASSEEEAIDLIQDLIRILGDGGFHLTKWMSSNEKVMASVPEKDRAKALVYASLGSDASERVLGVEWNVSSDQFRIKVDIPEKPATRRGTLSTTHSLFDPLGFVAPVIVEPKLLLRELSGRDWDEEISDDEKRRWDSWLSSLSHLQELSLPRCFCPTRCIGSLCEFHHFADASRTAYGAISYLRIEDNHGNVYCSFLMGKSHLAPSPITTIPRLELLAAVTAVRLDRTIRRELPTLKSAKSYFWSDSTSALYSIYNS